VHGVDEAEAFLHPAFSHEVFYRGSDIYKAATVGDFKPKVFGKAFHGFYIAKNPACEQGLKACRLPAADD
jgi:hypothetical protein